MAEVIGWKRQVYQRVFMQVRESKEEFSFRIIETIIKREDRE